MQVSPTLPGRTAALPLPAAPRPHDGPSATPDAFEHRVEEAQSPVPRPQAPIDHQQAAAQLDQLIGQILSDPKKEAEMIATLAKLDASGQLRPVLQEVARMAAESGQLPAMPDQKRQEMVDQLAGMIDAELGSHGLTPQTAGAVYDSWQQMGEKHLGLVRSSQIPPRRPGELSALAEPAFQAELESLQGAPFRAGNRLTPLINGPASFGKRAELIDGAQRSIHMLTWAFYDDETGWDTARRLVGRHEQGLDVQVIVDGQVGARPGHDKTLAYLREHGVPVTLWRDEKKPYDGQHRKMLVVDGQAAIVGGLNPGNWYSHMGPADQPKWRDTDLLLQGPAVADCEKLFASVGGTVGDVTAPQSEASARTAVVNHRPGQDNHIMLATMKAIQGASESIDIENAYFINTPGMTQVIKDALARGVRVRIHTNSAQSVDEPIVSVPILRSLPELVDAGAEVYLKKGDTLHSKFMVVDGLYTSLGSYNLHPRSERYEGEMMLNSLDTGTALELTRALEADIAVADRVLPGSLKVPENAISLLVSRYFFDQL